MAAYNNGERASERDKERKRERQGAVRGMRERTDREERESTIGDAEGRAGRGQERG